MYRYHYFLIHSSANGQLGCIHVQTYTLFAICKIDSQGEFAVWLRKLKQGLCINLEGWDGEEDGREIQKGGDICIPMAIHVEV